MRLAAEYFSLIMLPSIECFFLSIQNYETKGILPAESQKSDADYI